MYVIEAILNSEFLTNYAFNLGVTDDFAVALDMVDNATKWYAEADTTITTKIREYTIGMSYLN
jgi:hypothetical protein